MSVHNSPTFSVIIDTYNQAQFIHKTISSVLEQTYQDFEIIVVDDGSTDDTGSVVKTFTDPRLKYIYQENAGQANTLNIGIKNSSGKYIAFLDGDDFFLPHRLEAHIQILEERPEIGLVASGYVYVDETGQITHENQAWQDTPQLDLETWLFYCPTAPSAVSVRRNWLEKVGGFDENLPCGIDYDLWIRLAYAGCRSAWAETLVCAYRRHSDNQTNNLTALNEGTFAVLDKFFAMPDMPDKLVSLKTQLYAYTYLTSACQEYAASQVEIARQHMERAIELDPTLLDNQGKKIFEMVLMWSLPHMTDNPITYIKTAFENLPEIAIKARERKSEAMKIVAMDIFYEAYRKQDWPRLRGAFITAVLNRPALFLNRGILANVLESFVGGQLIAQAKRVVP